MLISHKKYLPSFALGNADQHPVCVYTVLSVNEQVRDCAAYQGVGPATISGDCDAFLERVRAGGEKISADEARQIFDEIVNMDLRYRR